jgi:molybdopterin synthase catalytic subunit/molybdopterin converting factor small subunit
VSGVQIRLRYFAQARDIAGRAEETWTLPDGATLAEVRRRLPTALSGFGLAVNRRWSQDDEPLADGDEVAVLPPVSGGEAPLLTRAPIDVSELAAAVSDPGAGAIVVFVGTVRNEFQGRPTSALVYEAYEEMAEAELRALLDEAKARFPVRGVALRHRLGRLELEEASVVIAVSAAHRAEAFDAARFLIEALKVRVPIWKKEISPAGDAWQSALTGEGGNPPAR